MTIRVNPELANLLGSAMSSNDAWSQALVSALGASRRIVCKRVTNESTPQEDVFSTGTTFRDMALTGTMTVSAGYITSFGFTSGTTTATAADLTSGKSVMRITGNNHWIEGTIGLSGSGADFTVPASPTATNSMAIASAMRLNPPPFLPSGTGPSAPPLDLSAPATLRIDDWTDPANPVVVGSLPFNLRDVDLVATDPEIAASMGDVRVTKSTQSIVFGNIEFGAMLLSQNASCNSQAAVPVHEVLVNCRPHGTAWANKYPSYTGYDSATDVTFPNPFKAYIINGSGAVIHTFEQRDGLPINSPLMPQFRDSTNALRPHFNCGQMLIWRSHEQKLNAKARKFFNGMTSDVMRSSTCKEPEGTNSWIPLGTDTQFNAALHWNALPQWPMPRGARNAEDYPNAVDPYLYNADTAGSNSINQENRTSGWDYEIGSISGHDRYNGPGGPRSDRAIFPPPLTAYLTNESGVRLKGNVPYKTMMTAWNKAYFNQARHFFKDVKSFEAIPQEEVFTNQWSHCLTYYSTNASGYAALVDNHIPLFARPASSSFVYRDKNGRRPWNGDAVDYMHAYGMSGWGALINNSPAHLVSHKHYIYSNILAWLGGGMSANLDYTGRFMMRQDAWHWLALTMAWKLASDHPTLGIKRSVVEARMQYYLDALYNSVYVPSLTSQTIFFQSIRNLGIPAQELKAGDQAFTLSSTEHSTRTVTSSLSFYMAGVFALMKQTGVWDMLWNKSAQNQTALTFWVQCYDKWSLDFAIETDIRYDYYIELTPRTPIAEPLAPLPTSWANWAATMRPKTGVEDWVTNPDGSMRNDRDATTHLRAQWALMRRDFDLYVPNSKIGPACTKYLGWYDTMATRLNSISTARSKAIADWIYRWPGHGILAAPPVEV